MYEQENEEDPLLGPPVDEVITSNLHSTDSTWKSSHNQSDVHSFSGIKRGLKRQKTQDLSDVVDELKNLNEILKKHNKDINDECMTFGKHIACQLRKLPLIQSSLAQNEIQQIITKYMMQAEENQAVHSKQSLQLEEKKSSCYSEPNAVYIPQSSLSSMTNLDIKEELVDGENESTNYLTS